MAGVQFFGKKAVIDAYNHRKIETWALFQGKNLITAGGDSDELNAFLSMLEPGGTTAAYTLKVYRNIEDPEEITEKSEANGSFAFKLTPPGYSVRSVGASEPDAIMQRMDRLEQLITGTGEEEEDEDEEESFQSIIMGYIKDPNKLSFAINAIKGLISGAMSPQPVGAVGAVSSPGSQEERIQRLSVALDTLESKDPKIVEHLEALAKIAQDKPGTFTMVLNMLENGL